MSGRVVKTGKSICGVLAAEDGLGALGAADPVALHRHDVLGPRLEAVEVGEQAIGVVGDPEVPLLELLRHDLGAAALAAAVDHLLVGEDGLVLRAPLDRGVGPVGEAGLEQPQEDPLRPAVVLGRWAAKLAAPVDRDAPVENCSRKLAIERSVETRGCSPVRIAWFSAGSPKES